MTIEQRHQAPDVPAVADKAIGDAASRACGDDASDVGVEQRLAPGEARGDGAVQGDRLIQNGLDQRGVEGPYGRDVVPDAMRAPQVAVLGQREAEEHGSGAPLEHRAAASWVSSAPDRRPGLERQVGEAGEGGQRGGGPFSFFFWGGGGGGRGGAAVWGRVGGGGPW